MLRFAVSDGLITQEWARRLGSHEETPKATTASDDAISEEEADKYNIPSNPRLALNLEPNNFLSQYVAYGAEVSDAYPDYWLMNGIEDLAIINDRKAYVNIKTARVYPNVYLNMLGASTTSHKSTTINKIMDILHQIDPIGEYSE